MTQYSSSPATRPEGQDSENHRPPGVFLFVFMALVSGSLFWTWSQSDNRAAADTSASDEFTTSELSEVDDRDIADALTTMAGVPHLLNRFTHKAKGCPLPLGWLSVARTKGQPPSKIRLRSGAYLSPIFDVGDAPVRVALPFPAPYETGRGQLTALGTVAGSSATVALTPPWRVKFDQGDIAVRNVHWRPVKRCANANG